MCRVFVKRAIGHMYTIDIMYKILITNDILPAQGTYSVLCGDLNGEEIFLKGWTIYVELIHFNCTVKKNQTSTTL